jgi:AraC-like DNA-binding protein
MHTDPLSDVMRAVRLSGGLFFRVELRPPYAVAAMGVDEIVRVIAPDAQQILPFHLVTRGPIWFEVPGAEPRLLRDGDLIMLPHGADHSLTDRLGSPSTPFGALQDAVSGTPPTLHWGGGGPPSEALCGFFHTSSRVFNPLIAALPEVIVVRHDPDLESWVTTTLERSFEETFEERPGAAALMERLTELLFLEILQRHVAGGDSCGLVGGLSDPLVAGVLKLMHAEPGRDWTIETLSESVNASRSVLSERFKRLVGLPPIRYLAAWRIELAAQRLSETRDSIAEISADAGYDSEAAFNRAFKRQVGDPPANWRRLRAARQPV